MIFYLRQGKYLKIFLKRYKLNILVSVKEDVNVFPSYNMIFYTSIITIIYVLLLYKHD